jgi:hypothetical protein
LHKAELVHLVATLALVAVKVLLPAIPLEALLLQIGVAAAVGPMATMKPFMQVGLAVRVPS